MNDPRVVDSWQRGEPYERFIGRWSRQIAPLFLRWLAVPPGRRWLDVGCGTGALSAAILETCSPSSVAGVEPSEGFRATARLHLAERAQVHAGSATAIPLEDAAIDVVVSGLVLNFVAEPAVALAEMRRVTREGGVLGAYVWDYSGKMELLQYFWAAASALDASIAPTDEAGRFPLCRPEALATLFTGARLEQVEVTAIDIPTHFPSFEDYWNPFLGGQGPASAFAMSLPEAERARLRENLRQRIPVQADGSIAMTARAWAVRGLEPFHTPVERP